jgi:hypothetical protein
MFVSRFNFLLKANVLLNKHKNGEIRIFTWIDITTIYLRAVYREIRSYTKSTKSCIMHQLLKARTDPIAQWVLEEKDKLRYLLS